MSTPSGPTTNFADDLADLPDEVVDYDLANALAYARILDLAEGNTTIDGRDWREGARIILFRDAEADERGAKRCWDSHLARAQWVTTHGFAQLVETAGAQAEPDQPAR